MSKIQYSTEECGLGIENAYDLEGCQLSERHEACELAYLVEKAADDYFDYHDGWESSWPMDIEIFSDGKSLGVFTVEMETVPQFSATKKPESAS